MDDDWTVITEDRKRDLVKTLYRLHETYYDMTRALDAFLTDAGETITAKKEQLQSIIQKIDTPEPKDVATATPVVQTAEHASVVLSLSEDERAVLRRAITDSAELYDLHPQMTRDMALIYGFALFDGLVADVIQAILVHVPAQLKSGRSITYEEALRFPAREALVAELARREVLQVTHMNAKDQIEYF